MKLTKKILILTIGLMILSSCQNTRMIHQKYPIISFPERPRVTKELSEEDFKKIIRYSKKLEIGIKKYNKYARKQNEKIERYFEKEK